MTALARAVFVVLLATLLLGAATAGGSPPPAQAASPSQTIVRKINHARRAHGLPPLRASRSLERSSRSYARSLVGSGRFAHQSLIRASRRFGRLGEVLALHRGWRGRVSRTVRMWLRSPGHRAVLLSGRYHYIGAGRARGRYHGGRATVWTAHLGS